MLFFCLISILLFKITILFEYIATIINLRALVFSKGGLPSDVAHANRFHEPIDIPSHISYHDDLKTMCGD
jgi:hypothetical protein